jgi:ATP-dependent DNA helicase HFM1/MER3
MHLLTKQVIRAGEHVTIKIRADLGFINDKTPEYFKKQPVYVCLMAELSDGHLLHFARIRYSHRPFDPAYVADEIQCEEAQ